MPLRSILHIVFLSLALAACSSSETSDDIICALPPEYAWVGDLSEKELVIEWLVMAEHPEDHIGDQRSLAICDRLDGMHPTALAPFIKILGYPATSDASKIFVLQCITVNMDADYIPYLLPLLDSEFPTTRSCTLTLLGAIDDPAVITPLLRMKQDPDPRVAFSAWSGLAQRGQEPHRQRFMQYYLSPDVTTGQRTEVIRILLKDTRPEDEFIVTAIIIASETPPAVRNLFVIALGTIGHPSSIKALENSTSLDPSDEYRALVQSTIAVIQERNTTAQ